jgi:hypothetical protein
MLEQLGSTVVDESGVAPGAPLPYALHTLLAGCDRVVAVLSSAVPSQWVAEEMGLAQRLGKPLLLLKDSSVAQVAGLPESSASQGVTLGDPDHTRSALATFLAS